MIDFRYHVVSLVAVFLALATGIVIGATALQGQVAGTLENQAGQLRQDKQTLRSQLDRANSGGTRQDQLVADLAPKALAGELTGRKVALVTLPGTSGAVLREMRTSVEQAGGTVTVVAGLGDAWVSGSSQDREKTLREVASTQGQDVSSVPSNRLAGLVLADALSIAPGKAAPAQTGLSKLVSEGYLDTDPGSPQMADSFVLLWPGFASSDEKTAAIWSDLVTAVGLSGRPTVGVSTEAGSAGDSPRDVLIRQLRDSAQVAGAMSTVDDGALAVGRVATVLALREEYAGRSGHYGLDSDASAAAPTLTVSATQGSE